MLAAIFTGERKNTRTAIGGLLVCKDKLPL